MEAVENAQPRRQKHGGTPDGNSHKAVEDKKNRRTGGSLTSHWPHEMELWEIERLIPNPKNARMHSTEQIRELAASISAFGFMSAVVAGSDGIVLAGNARVLAARELGLSRVPVIVADHLSESEKQAFAIADNHANELHPTMKPVELVERAIVNSSQRDGVVLDPFGGSGSTLIACETKGRHARLVEIEPRYCDVIVKRWQDFTGKAAIHRGSGKTFHELAEQRQLIAIGPRSSRSKGRVVSKRGS